MQFISGVDEENLNSHTTKIYHIFYSLNIIMTHDYLYLLWMEWHLWWDFTPQSELAAISEDHHKSNKACKLDLYIYETIHDEKPQQIILIFNFISCHFFFLASTMARRKVKREYIVNDSARKTTYRKRKKGLIKKVDELSTLCGIEACAIIYSPFEPQPVVWPSPPGVQKALERLKTMPELEQSKKMVNQ